MLETLVMAVDRSRERGQPLSAAQVYRVLDQLAAANRVQRIELLSTWLVSQDERQGFLVCQCCRSVEAFPLTKLQLSVDRLCRTAGFAPTRSLFEVSGPCGECAGRGTATLRACSSGKDRTMMNRLKVLLAGMTTLGAVIAAAPADAGDLPNTHVHADGTVAAELYSALVSLHGRADPSPAWGEQVLENA